jgi:carbamoyl-phosphate synthase small subunit
LSARTPGSPARWGTLFLEDGSRWEGRGIGAGTTHVGEVVFTTGMVGYPESLTDPSFRGQILTFTYPLLGNYGVPSPSARDRHGLPTFLESEEIQVRGVVVRGITAANHWKSHMELDAWLTESEVPGVVGIDTRRLTEHLRAEGVVRGILAVSEPGEERPSTAALRAALRNAPKYAEEDYMAQVSPKVAHLYGGRRDPLVALPDCGVKTSIIRSLLNRKVAVLRLPFDAEIPEKWEGRRVAGLLVGNGPGDPAELTAAIEALRDARRRALPTLGICLGQQLLALSRGGKTYKMKYGHRGQNKTVVFTDRTALIASENHGYAVDPKSLKRTELKPWAINPDDGTVEALRDARGRTIALQGHPEGHPGPQEAGFVFDQFVAQLHKRSA